MDLSPIKKCTMFLTFFGFAFCIDYNAEQLTVKFMELVVIVVVVVAVLVEEGRREGDQMGRGGGRRRKRNGVKN
jgi:hypothetical protein